MRPRANAALGSPIAFCRGIGVAAFCRRAVRPVERAAAASGVAPPSSSFATGWRRSCTPGCPPSSALGTRAAELPDWSRSPPRRASAAMSSAALREAASRPGAAGLVAVAAAWEVSARSGRRWPWSSTGSACGAARRGGGACRGGRSTGAAPGHGESCSRACRSSVCPGMSMGARPLDFLLGSGPGSSAWPADCLLAGLGLVWVERLAQTAEVD